VGFDTLFDVLPDGVLVVDGGGVVRRANGAAGRLLGYAPAELVSVPLRQLLPPSAEGAAMLEPWPPASGSNVLRAPVWFRKGAAIEVDWSFATTTDDDGGAAVVAIMRQRTADLEPARTADPDSRAAHVMRLVFEHAPLGIFHFDERGVLTATNERFVQLLGSTRERLVGLNLTMLPDPRVRDCIIEALAGRAAQFEGEYVAVTGDRTTPLRVVFEPILQRDGHVLGGVGLAEDISERSAAERRAAQAERLVSLGTLAAGVVHELQNPLAFVIASLDLASRHLTSLESGPLLTSLHSGPPSSGSPLAAVRGAVDNAREGAWRVATIIRDLKAFARSDEERRKPIDVHAPLEAALKLVMNQVRHRATIQRDLRATSKVRASESRLVQLFVNLLLNAAEAIPEGHADRERITLGTEDDGDDVAITVEDTGKGIAPEVRERLFEPFVSDKPGGMGLGLAICHGLVAALGGSVSAVARLPRGTRFVIRLPAAPREEASEHTPLPMPVAPPQSGRVLVVDDEERLAETIRMVLSPLHDVDVCFRGRDVLDRIRQGREYDVVLCDLMMPDLSGPELFEQVKALDPKLAERFIFLTGGAFTARTREFLQEVGNPRLEKPFELEALERIVQDALAARA